MLQDKNPLSSFLDTAPYYIVKYGCGDKYGARSPSSSISRDRSSSPLKGTQSTKDCHSLLFTFALNTRNQVFIHHYIDVIACKPGTRLILSRLIRSFYGQQQLEALPR